MLDSVVKIGAAAAQSGVAIETIRFYEQIGVLPSPERAGNGYRLYSKEHISRLKVISRCRGLGLSLDSIRSLLALADNPNRTCETVRSVAQNHLDDVRKKLADLTRVEQALNELVGSCGGGASPDCSILDILFDGAD